MKFKFKAVALSLVLGLLPCSVKAASYWVLSYTGTSTSGSTNQNSLVTVPVTEDTFIQNCASNSGVSTADLVLVLHANANELGDTLEVINRNDPNLFRCEVFKLAYNFSGSPSQSYTNAAGTVLKRWAYVFSADGGHSRGSAIINERAANSRGGANAPVNVDGKLQYWLGEWMESTPEPDPAVCSGTFKAKETLTFP
jgi:hypothetical protein